MERQPTRSKRVREDRRFDKTQLRASGHGRTVHRDYASHVLRWNFVAQQSAQHDQGEVDTTTPIAPYLRNIFFKYGWVAREVKQGMKILDVGCGQDQPLLYILGARIQTVPELYVGVDLNRIMKKSNVRWARIHDEYNFVDNDWPDRTLGPSHDLREKYGEFDVAVNFEVIEHMAVEDGKRLLTAIFRCLKSGGVLYLSTPVFDGLAAANHIHEYTIPELQAAIETAGFKIEHRYGTFASKYPIWDAMIKAGRPDHLKTYQELEKWFGGDVLATFMAPLYPDASRNNLWVCRKP
jgi:2-polyprenyl-3-methyl-5-hydroxy-6-metoxy-1,4-benzoquinol methylase